eukprot:10220099-Lingulodinium_polyedra.AAC.1
MSTMLIVFNQCPNHARQSHRALQHAAGGRSSHCLRPPRAIAAHCPAQPWRPCATRPLPWRCRIRTAPWTVKPQQQPPSRQGRKPSKLRLQRRRQKRCVLSA